MPNYRKLGKLPTKRHIKLEIPSKDSFLGEGIYYEHVLTTDGFSRAYSIMYHNRPPTRITKTELAGQTQLD